MPFSCFYHRKPPLTAYILSYKKLGFNQKKLYDYYKKLWEGYDEWVYNHYNVSPIVTIDIDKYDYVNNEEDKKEVLNIIKEKLEEIRK